MGCCRVHCYDFLVLFPLLHQWQASWAALHPPFQVHGPFFPGPCTWGSKFTPGELSISMIKQELAEMQCVQINYSGKPSLTLLSLDSSFSVRSQREVASTQ